jgi:dimethylhistidine N-methyltransferase
MNNQFATDVLEGLSQTPKQLSSKYFYDEIGDSLFIKIMELPEYYLTRSEYEIFKSQSQEIIDSLKIDKSIHFELIELGAGDGTKTIELLKVLCDEGYLFTYVPIDISANVLSLLEDKLNAELPKLNIQSQQGDYFTVLGKFKESHHPKVVLFLGSNIGNMSDVQASQFVYDLGANLDHGDKLMLGVDLIKSAGIVLPAYDDAQGVTSAFNLNLLHRINEELGATFNLTGFTHAPEYSEEEGVARSYLQSTEDQTVAFSSFGRSFTFAKGEKIQVEISRKYSTEIIEKIIEPTDFKTIAKLTDRKGYFADYIFEKS